MTRSISKKNHPIIWIALSKLSCIWIEAQRSLNERKWKRILKEFDPDGFGVLSVSAETQSGQHHVIDGQHRKRAAEHYLGDPNQKVPCEVLPTDDPVRCAEIWMMRNAGRTKPHAMERFKVAVTAGRAAESAIHELLQGLGYRVAGDKHPGSFSAVEACLYLYRRPPGGLELLRETLLVIQAAWGRTPESVASPILKGVAELIVCHREELDSERLVDCMAKKTNPRLLIGQARGIQFGPRKSLPVSIAAILREQYNSGLRKHKLEAAA